MPLILLSGPAEEPVTLADARAQLRLDGTEENALVEALIAAARATLEAETRRAFVTQSWRLTLDAWPHGAVMLPLAPVQSVTAVAVADAAGAMTALDAGLYETALAGDAPRLAPTGAWPQPATRLAGIEIDFTAGYGAAADVPPPLKQALLLLVAHWFEHREPMGAGTELPRMITALVAPYRRLRL
ncbi:MAG: head-tail connector protein [Parvibaculum sp.]|nr:head-tail connector protein [Parvibaculum sp.]